MTNSMFYLPFVLLSFGVGGLKPTPPILKSYTNVQTLQVQTQNLEVLGIDYNFSTLFIGGSSYEFGDPLSYTLASFNDNTGKWDLFLEITDTSKVGTQSTTITIKGSWDYGGENREYTLTYPYNNTNNNFFTFGVNLSYGDPMQPSGVRYYWAIDSISVSNTTPIYREYETIDLPSVIFTIFTLPFTFMTKAFDVTIFPGTSFQVNFSNLVMLILGGITFIYIIHFLFKTFIIDIIPLIGLLNLVIKPPNLSNTTSKEL